MEEKLAAKGKAPIPINSKDATKVGLAFGKYNAKLHYPGHVTPDLNAIKIIADCVPDIRASINNFPLCIYY